MTEIRLIRTAAWGVMAAIWLGLAGLAVGLTVTQAAGDHPEVTPLWLALAAMWALTGVLFLAGARRAPTIAVTANGLIFDVPGHLRQPLSIPRHQVRAVYLRDAFDIKDDARSQIRISNYTLPSLTYGMVASATEWKLLFVLAPPVRFGGLVRRTALVRSFATGLCRFSASLPGATTVARGIACEPAHLQEAVDALWSAGYEVTRPPYSPADVDWLRRGGA